MSGSIDEYRPGRFRLRLYWKNRHWIIYRDRHGELLETRRQAEKALFIINTEIQEKIFSPEDWIKDRPFKFDKAAESWRTLKVCGDDWGRARWWSVKKHILPKFGAMDIREIRSVHFAEFQLELQKKGLEEKSIKNIIGILNSILRFHRDSIPRLPVPPTIRVQEKEIPWLSWEQQDKVFRYLEEADLPIFWFLRMTGCRPSEACGLYREDVDEDKGIITIKRAMGDKVTVHEYTKNRRIKKIPIFDELAWTLKPREATRYVFSKGGQPYTRRRLEASWAKANATANERDGVPIIHLKNATRHSFASQRINEGFSMDLISKALGHTSIKITEKVYASISPKSLEDVYRGRVMAVSQAKRAASNMPKEKDKE